jgi:hypothetical protein
MYRGLRNKAVINFDAAEKLIQLPNYHFCASIHCAYFSCFQVLKFILLAIFEEKEEEVYAKRKTGTREIGEHEYYIQKIHESLLSTNDFVSAQNFKNKINELKSLRTVSDYKIDTIEKPKSEYAIKLADDILKILRKNFKYDN